MDIKQVLAAFGIKSSFAAGIIGAFWLVGVTPVYSGGKTMPQEVHTHFVKPTSMDLANNDKTEIQKYYMGVQYQIDKHKQLLKDLKVKYDQRSVEFQVEFQLWKTENDKLQKQFDYWLKRTQENQTLVETLIAGRA